MKNPKQEIVTFKADRSLLQALHEMPNRSEFIRRAILEALDNVCPLCQGTGVLTPNQKKHWEAFAGGHSLAECGNCHEIHLVCESQGGNEHPE